MQPQAGRPPRGGKFQNVYLSRLAAHKHGGAPMRRHARPLNRTPAAFFRMMRRCMMGGRTHRKRFPSGIRRMWDENRETFSCSPLRRLCGARDGNRETFSCGPLHRLCSMDTVLSGSAGAMRHGFAR